MCGLVGIATQDFQKGDITAFENMLYLDTIRGWDSTGVGMISKPNSRKKVDHIFTHKRAITGMEFLATRVWEAMSKTAFIDGRVLFGHNRAATKGAVCDMNAHPFTHDNITLMHNGSLGYWRNIGGIPCNFDVDSEAICYALSKCTTYADASAVISDIQGAFALVWHDTDDDTINFVRNEERPLWYANVETYQGKNRGIIWASEEEFITIAARKGGINISEPTKVPVGQWVSISVETLRVVASTEVEVHVPKKYQAYTVSKGKTGQSTETQTSGQKKTGASGAATGQASTGTSKPAGKNVNVAGAPVSGDHFECVVKSEEDWSVYPGPRTRKEADSEQPLGFLIALGKTDTGAQFNVTIHNVPADKVVAGVYRGRCTAIVPTIVARDNLCAHCAHSRQDAIMYMGPTETSHAKLFKAGSADSKSVTRVFDAPPPDDDVPFGNEAYVKGPGGMDVTVACFEKLVKDGCGICSCDLDATDAPELDWVDSAPLCPDCSDEYHNTDKH